MSVHRHLRLAAIPIAIAILCAAMPAADTAHWERIRGVNFFTSSASNATTMWRSFDSTVADRELGWMEALGFNSVRLWLSERAWREQRAAFLDALGRCLDLCAKHRLSAMLVLFDSCGIEPRAGAVEMTVAEAYEHFLKSPDVPEAQKKITQARYAQFASGRGRLMRVPLAPDTPPDILFWQHWTPNPGLSRLGAEHWPEMDAYADAVMALAARRPAVIAVDVMNEPSTLMDLPPGASFSGARNRVSEFVAHVAARLHSKYPNVEQTIGSADLKDLQALARYQTVLSIHSYQLGDDLAKTLRAAAAFARETGKPILLTEGLANTDDWLRSYGDESLSTDEGQLRHY